MKLFNQYEIRGWSEGGMGRVYFVFDQVTQNNRVIKVIKDELQKTEEAIKLFEREARAWINLGDHPHIVRAISFNREPGPYLLEEFIDGPSLNELLKREGGRLSLRQAVVFAIQIARGLVHAHTCQLPDDKTGIIHRDLKPHNILINRKCQAKIVDFGLAKIVGDATSGNIRGTLAYMPPEQLRGKNIVLGSDLYSLGVTLYQMVSGCFPFPGPRDEMARQIQYDPPSPIADTRPDAPGRLQRFIYLCLNKKANQRPKSAEVVVRKLSEILTGLPAEKTTPCPKCGYISHTQRTECPVCEPPFVMPHVVSAPRPAARPAAPPKVDPVVPPHKPPAPPPAPLPNPVAPLHEPDAQPALNLTGQTTWICQNGHLVPSDFPFCPECGAMNPQALTCPDCQTVNPSGFLYCCGCRRPLKSDALPNGNT